MDKGISRTIAPIQGISTIQIQGGADASGMRFGLVAARFNAKLTDELVRSACRCLEQHGAGRKAIDIVRVPGSYEIPVIVEKMAAGKRYDALIALGVVLEGETRHAQMIIDSTGWILLNIACRHQVPVINEIISAVTWEQAEMRCFGDETARGWYAGKAAIETALVYRKLE